MSAPVAFDTNPIAWAVGVVSVDAANMSTPFVISVAPL